MFKCVFVGDDFKIKGGQSTSGFAKAAIINKIANPLLDFTVSFPMTAENIGTELILENKTNTLTIWDTAGIDKCSLMLRAFFPADIFLLIFSVKNKETFDHASEWANKLKQISPTKIMLLGITDDFCVSNVISAAERVVSMEEAYLLAEQMGAIDYQECSIHDSFRIKKILNILFGHLFGKNLDKTPVFFKKYFNKDGISAYINGAIEIAKGRRQADSILSKLPDELITQILNEVGKEFASPKKIDQLTQFFLKSIPVDGGLSRRSPKPGLRFFNYAFLEPTKVVKETEEKKRKCIIC